MTAAPERPSTRRTSRDRRPRRWSWGNVLIAVVVFAGAGAVLYPTAADWFSDRAHATEVSGYVADVTGSSADELSRMLDSARRYNETLPPGPLRDPYTLNSDGTPESVQDGWEAYVEQLAFREDAPIARVRIPKLSLDLPIYHGTSEDVLERGVGHLYGSSLPVGGSGSHAVLTGHSGLPSATLFTHLDELAQGDLFYVEVAGRTLAYQVDQIKTVTPDSGDDLRQIVGEDHVTLLTCTPIGVNTHRLLVRGERVSDPADARIDQLPANATDPGFPWWSLFLVAAIAFSIVIAWPRTGTDSGERALDRGSPSGRGAGSPQPGA